VYVQTFSDTADRATRQYVLELVPTILDAQDTERARAERVRLATEWLRREFCDKWLRCVGLGGKADALAGLFSSGFRVDTLEVSAWADECDRAIQTRLGALPDAVATEGYVFADRAADISGGTAAAALCRMAGLRDGTTPATAPSWFTVAWRAWATGWFAANLCGSIPEFRVAGPTTAASLQVSAVALLEALIAAPA
jgi:hypothetical protein